MGSGREIEHAPLHAAFHRIRGALPHRDQPAAKSLKEAEYVCDIAAPGQTRDVRRETRADAHHPHFIRAARLIHRGGRRRAHS